MYALATEENIPATKATGKWVFTRELIDRKISETTYGGAFTDRLVVAGSEDPLLYGALVLLSNTV